MGFPDQSAKFFALGSLAIGTWGVIHPKSLTTLLGDRPELGRLLGARDLIVGAALLAVGGPVPLAMRVASDLHDAVRLRDRSPLVAAGAAAVALWGAAALASCLAERPADSPTRRTAREHAAEDDDRPGHGRPAELI